MTVLVKYWSKYRSGPTRGGQASMAGLIIGAGGRTKTRIEQDSGARMQVRRPRRRRAFLRWV